MSLPSILGPLPESLRRGVYEAYHAQYGQFMVRVIALEEGTMSLEKVDNYVFDVLGYDQGPNYKLSRTTLTKSHRPDLYRMFVEWSTSAPPVVVGEKKKVPFWNMLGPLPQELNTGVYKAYGHAVYGQFMRRVVALEEGTMSLEKADNDVFAILGYDGGKMDRDPGYRPFRDSSSESHRPDLYRMFVEWSTATPPVVAKKKHKSVPFSFGVIGLPAAPPETLCLDSLTDEVLAKDLIALDAALTMSPTMLTALRVGAGGPSVPFSFGAMRELWHKELLKRVSTDTPHK